MEDKTPKTTRIEKNKLKRKKPSKPLEIHNELKSHTWNFLGDLVCAREMFKTVIPILKKMDDDREKKKERLIEDLKAAISKKPNSTRSFDSWKLFLLLRSTMRELDKMHRADRMFRCNSIVLLVSKYDEFLANVFNCILRAKPDQLKSSERTLNYGDIVGLHNINEVIDKFVSKEIDKIIRSSHEEQLEFLDNRHKLCLKDQFKSWNDFIEITERRNLYVHAGGRANSQYLFCCKSHNIKIDSKIKENSFLPVTKEYFENAYKCIFELGVIIGQSVLRRVFPDQLESADKTLLEVGVDILEEDEQWELGKIIFDYALSLPAKLVFNDESYKVFIINSCICLKHMAKIKEMNDLISRVDWSSANPKFHLAIKVLEEKYAEAEELMSRMNGKDPINEGSFRAWPLFLEFRKTEYFARAFKRIYKRDYEPKMPPEIVEPAIVKPEEDRIH